MRLMIDDGCSMSAGARRTAGSAFRKPGAPRGSSKPTTWTVAISDGQPTGLLIRGVPVGVMLNGKIDLLCKSRKLVPSKCKTIDEVAEREWKDPRKTVKHGELSQIAQACLHAVSHGWGMAELDGATGETVVMAADSPAAGFDGQQRIVSKMLEDAAGMAGVRVVDWAECVDGLRLRPSVVLCQPAVEQTPG